MNFLFRPFESLMHRLKYPRKFILIFLVFFIPIIGSLALILNNTVGNINVAKEERIGLESNVRLQALVQNVQQHRGMSASFLGGNTAMSGDMATKQAEIAGNINDFEQMFANKNVASHSGKWQEVKDEWTSLSENVEKISASESFDRHTNLVAIILQLSSSISDSTYLSLETDLVRHHLAKLITEDLILNTEYMGQARAIGSNVLASKQLSPEQQVNLIYLTRIVDEHLAETENSMNIVLSENEEARETMTNLFEDAISASTSLNSLIAAEILDKEIYTYDSEAFFDAATVAIDTVYDFINGNVAMLDSFLADHIAKLTFQKNVTLYTNVVAVILAIFLFIGFYRSIQDSVRRINDSTAKISDGDLTERIEILSKDETKEIEYSINNMVDSIQHLIKVNQEYATKLGTSAKQLSYSSNESVQASEQIANVTQIVAEGAEKQTIAVANANESTEEAALYIQEVSASSSEMLNKFEETKVSTEQGALIVEEVLNSINEIQAAVQTSTQIVEALGDSSVEIGHIVSLITDISNQTNLLALNAAIEASRAGEHGSGFAVVAEEVRALAEQSNNSAEQISQLVKTIQNQTNEAVISMERGIERVNRGIDRAAEVSSVFQNINIDVNNLTDRVKVVAQSVENIREQSDQVDEMMDHVRLSAEESLSASQESSAASEEQLAAMEEISSAAESLLAMSDELQTLIERFKVN